jgi:ATP-dependent RNA helicase DeaD
VSKKVNNTLSEVELSEVKTVINKVNFSDLNLIPSLCQVLQDVGYDSPTQIQQQTIPAILSGKDIIALAQTGSGKTAAFVLPILQLLETEKIRNIASPQILILTPTRELSQQVADSIKKYSKSHKWLKTALVVGGASFMLQKRTLTTGAHIVVGTVGRVVDHMDRGSLSLENIRCVVLDEADEMLAMGFVDDIEAILAKAPKERQTILFSATMPPAIRNIAHKSMKQPLEIQTSSARKAVDTIDQGFCIVPEADKLAVVTRFLQHHRDKKTLVFVRTKLACADVATSLNSRGFRAVPLNGDMKQSERTSAVTAFKQGNVSILVATDVAARGLDIQDVGLVLNMDIPQDIHTYIHRIGRTGRAGKKGNSIICITPKERGFLSLAKKYAEDTLTEVTVPSLKQLSNDNRMKMSESIANVINSPKIEAVNDYIDLLAKDIGSTQLEVAKALIALHLPEEEWKVAKDTDTLLERLKKAKENSSSSRYDQRGSRGNSNRSSFGGNNRSFGNSSNRYNDRNDRNSRFSRDNDRNSYGDRESISPMVACKVRGGQNDGFERPKVLTTVARKLGIRPRELGKVTLSEHHCTVEIPKHLVKNKREIEDILFGVSR